MPWDASRIMRRDARGRRRRTCSPAATARAASRASRPTARASRGCATARWSSTASRCSPDNRNRSARSRRGRRANVRTRGRPTARELAWCRNESGFGRLVIGAPGPQVGARALAGLAPRPRRGAQAGSSCVRSGAVTPPQVVVLAANGSGRRAIARGPVGGLRARPALVEPRPVTWKSGERDRARPAVARADAIACGVAAGRARARRPDRSGARRLEPAGPVARAAGLHRAAAEPPRLVRLRRARTATRSTAAGASVDVADVAAGIRHAIKEGWADAGPGRADGRERGRLHRAERRRRSIPISSRPSIASYPVTDLVDLAAHDAPVRVGRRLAARRSAARRARRVRRPLADHARGRRSARRCCCCTATTTTSVHAGAVRRVRRCAARARASPSSTTCTPAKDTDGGARRPSPTSSTRIGAFLTRWC